MKSRHTMDLTSGSVTKKLLSFVYPLLIANLLQQLYQSADNAVVGRYVGADALAAVGATGSATTLVLNMIIGLAVGANIVNANLLGANNQSGLRKSMHTAMLVAFVGGLLVSATGILVSKPLLRLMRCDPDVLDDATLYMRIIFCGTPGTMIYNFGAGILRTHGDSRRPMVMMMVSGLVNVLLNLVFVLVFHMSVDGVALATIISKYISAVWVLCVLFDPKGDFKLSFQELKFRSHECWNIVKVGVPCGINGMVFGISNVIVQAAINDFGKIEMSGSAASGNIVNILYQILIAFYSACVSFSGQCYGAGKIKRIDKVLYISSGICITAIGLLSLLLTLFPSTFLSIFVKDPDVIRAGTVKMVIMAWSYILYAVSEVFLGCLRGMRCTTFTTVINVIRICGIRLLWIWVICPLQPDNTVLLYLCYPVSYVFSLSSLGYYYFRMRRKAMSKQEDLKLAT